MSRLLLLFLLCYCQSKPWADTPVGPKINGVNFVAPPRQVGDACMLPVKQINAGWVALNPYAFGRKGQPDIIYNVDRQMWGEKMEGVKACVEHARKQQLKVMIKPHVWVQGEGWAGDFTLSTEEGWKSWEKNYARYILDFADLSEANQVEMLCIGTEYRQAVRQRPNFWKNLISQVRTRYKGKLTYAANWDEYTTVPFWNQLDYIGIDAYFPISSEVTPTAAELISGWEKESDAMKAFSERQKKPILFAEYGYRSIDKTAWKQWELPDGWHSKAPANLIAQTNAYEALYRTFWNQPWFAGGFIWKWYDDHGKAGGNENSDYTPQHKPAEQVIRKYYGSL